MYCLCFCVLNAKQRKKNTLKSAPNNSEPNNHSTGKKNVLQLHDIYVNTHNPKE